MLMIHSLVLSFLLLLPLLVCLVFCDRFHIKLEPKKTSFTCFRHQDYSYFRVVSLILIKRSNNENRDLLLNLVLHHPPRFYFLICKEDAERLLCTTEPDLEGGNKMMTMRGRSFLKRFSPRILWEKNPEIHVNLLFLFPFLPPHVKPHKSLQQRDLRHSSHRVSVPTSN